MLPYFHQWPHPHKNKQHPPIAHFRVAACLSFKASPGAQPFKWKWVAYSYANQTHFPYNRWTPRLTSKPRQTATRKWPISLFALTKAKHSKRQLSKSFTVVIRPLSTRLINYMAARRYGISLRVLKNISRVSPTTRQRQNRHFKKPFAVISSHILTSCQRPW